MNEHKKHRPGSSGGWSFQPLGSETRLKNPDQLLSKRIRQNFDGMVIDDGGNIEVDDSDDEYSEEIDDELFDDYQQNTRKRRRWATLLAAYQIKDPSAV